MRCSDQYIMIDTASNMLIDQFVQTSSCLNNMKYHNQPAKTVSGLNLCLFIISFDLYAVHSLSFVSKKRLLQKTGRFGGKILSWASHQVKVFCVRFY